MADYILIGKQGKLTDLEYYDKLLGSFKGRIAYSKQIYMDTAFQWLGPAIKVFRKHINFETRFVKAYWLNADGVLQATGCRVDDSWGYHPGTMWHRVPTDELDLESYREFVNDKNNAEWCNKYIARKDWIVDKKDYMKLVRNVWKERSEVNLRKYVSAEESVLKSLLEKRIEESKNA